MAQKISAHLEISSRSVKLLETTGGNKKAIRVVGCQRQEYDGTKIKLESTVRELLEKSHSRPAFVTTSVWAPTMLLRRVAMPLMNPQELPGAIALEADKHIPFSVDDCILDHYVIERSETTKKIDIMLIAAKKDLIVERCQTLRQAGLDIRFMDVHPLVLTNLYFHLHPDDQNRSVALVHLGDVPGKIKGEDNFLSVAHQGIPYVVRDLGDKLSQNPVTDESWSQLVSLVANGLLFFENNTQRKVDEVLLSGEVSVCEKLKPLLAAHCQKKINRWSPLEKIDFDRAEHKSFMQENESSLLVCLGLAARGGAK